MMARRAFFGLAACAAGSIGHAARNYGIVRNVPYLPAPSAETLDLYVPRGGEGPVPTVIVIHGGGGLRGDKGDGTVKQMCAWLADAGYVAAAVNYREGAHAWPQNLLDCKNAVRFLRSQAPRHRVDASRIAVAGPSAGGLAALLVGFTSGAPGFEPGPPYAGTSDAVRCVIDLYGPTDLLNQHAVDANGGALEDLTDDTAIAEIVGYHRAENPAVWKAISPLYHVAAGAPPVFVAHGKADPIEDYHQSEQLVAALKRCGVPCEFVLLEGIGHGFNFQAWRHDPLPVDIRPQLKSFLAKYLGPPAAKPGVPSPAPNRTQGSAPATTSAPAPDRTREAASAGAI